MVFDSNGTRFGLTKWWAHTNFSRQYPHAMMEAVRLDKFLNSRSRFLDTHSNLTFSHVRLNNEGGIKNLIFYMYDNYASTRFIYPRKPALAKIGPIYERLAGKRFATNIKAAYMMIQSILLNTKFRYDSAFTRSNPTRVFLPLWIFPLVLRRSKSLKFFRAYCRKYAAPGRFGLVNATRIIATKPDIRYAVASMFHRNPPKHLAVTQAKTLPKRLERDLGPKQKSNNKFFKSRSHKKDGSNAKKKYRR